MAVVIGKKQLSHLVLGTVDQQVALAQPAHGRLGVPKGRAGQGDAAPFLGLHILRGRLREGGRS